MGLPILKSTEDAFKYLVTNTVVSQSLGIPVFTGIDNLDKTGPCVICYAESAVEEFPFGGVYHVSANITVKELAADSSVSSSLGAVIFEGCLTNNTQQILNSYSSSYNVYGYWITDTTDNVDGDSWIQQYKLEVVSVVV